MSRLFDDASSQYLETDNAVVSAAPMTLACWGKSDNLTVDQVGVAIIDRSQTLHYWSLRMSGNQSGDPIQFAAQAGISQGFCETSTSYSANTWTHCCGVETSSADRKVFMDALGKGTNTTDVSPSGADRTSVGREGGSTPRFHMSGRVADVLVLKVAATDAEVTNIKNGFLPRRIRPSDVAGYWPIFGKNDPELDWSSNDRDLTVNGATKSDDFPPQRLHPIFDRSYRNRSRGMRRQISKGISTGGFEP